MNEGRSILNRQYLYSLTALGQDLLNMKARLMWRTLLEKYKETYGKLRLGYQKTLKMLNALRILR